MTKILTRRTPNFIHLKGFTQALPNINRSLKLDSFFLFGNPAKGARTQETARTSRKKAHTSEKRWHTQSSNPGQPGENSRHLSERYRSLELDSYN